MGPAARHDEEVARRFVPRVQGRRRRAVREEAVRRDAADGNAVGYPHSMSRQDDELSFSSPIPVKQQ